MRLFVNQPILCASGLAAGHQYCVTVMHKSLMDLPRVFIASKPFAPGTESRSVRLEFVVYLYHTILLLPHPDHINDFWRGDMLNPALLPICKHHTCLKVQSSQTLHGKPIALSGQERSTPSA